jgi:C4-dicarboxylate transporter DctQ subunit
MRAAKHILVSEWIVIIVFVVMVVATFLQVVTRYLLSFSLPWADELARHCLVWMVFIGMVSALVRGQHVTVDILLVRYRGRLRRWALSFIDLASAVLFGVLLYGGVLLMQLTATQITSGMGLPKPVVYAAVPIGAALMLIEFGLRILRRFTGREVPTPTGTSA